MQTAAYLHDADHTPITYGGLITSNSKTLVGNNTTVAVPLFTVVGKIEVTALYGDVTTALGNNTVAFWRTNDGSTQNPVTLATGTTITNAIKGAVISKKAGVATALTLSAGTSVIVGESATAGANYFQDFVVFDNSLATSNIEFVYTTTDTPTTGVINFHLRWAPLTQSSTVIAI